MGKEMGSRGDFNEIVTQEDKQWGNLRLENSFKLFREFIRETDMEGVSFCGKIWIWASNRSGEGLIEKRLDMFFGSAEWLWKCNKAVVKHIMTQLSDHFMVLLYPKPKQ